MRLWWKQFLPLYWILLVFVPLYTQNLLLLYTDVLFFLKATKFPSNRAFYIHWCHGLECFWPNSWPLWIYSCFNLRSYFLRKIPLYSLHLLVLHSYSLTTFCTSITILINTIVPGSFLRLWSYTLFYNIPIVSHDIVKMLEFSWMSV